MTRVRLDRHHDMVNIVLYLLFPSETGPVLALEIRNIFAFLFRLIGQNALDLLFLDSHFRGWLQLVQSYHKAIANTKFPQFVIIYTGGGLHVLNSLCICDL